MPEYEINLSCTSRQTIDDEIRRYFKGTEMAQVCNITQR